MNGSPKQVTWALDIRQTVIDMIGKLPVGVAMKYNEELRHPDLQNAQKWIGSQTGIMRFIEICEALLTGKTVVDLMGRPITEYPRLRTYIF